MVESCSHKAVVDSSSLSIRTGYNNMNKGLGSKMEEHIWECCSGGGWALVCKTSTLETQ